MTVKEIFQALIEGKTVVEIPEALETSTHVPLEIKLVNNILTVVNCTNPLRRNTPAMEYDTGKLIAYKWAIKPEVIFINGIEVPKPESVAPKYDSYYYYPVIDCTDLDDDYSESQWEADSIDIERLNLGIVHLTKEAASKHAQALLSFTRNTDV